MILVLFYISRDRYGFLYLIISLVFSFYLLLLPALQLNKTREKAQAMALFNKASYFPLALLAVVVLSLSFNFLNT
jgi:4-hydroxybenzoate polyprenyltransferase